MKVGFGLFSDEQESAILENIIGKFCHNSSKVNIIYKMDHLRFEICKGTFTTTETMMLKKLIYDHTGFNLL